MSTTTPLQKAKATLAKIDKQLVPFDFDAATGQIWFDAEIGSGLGEIDSRAVRTVLTKIGNKPATVHLNTPGGSVTEGWAIHRLLSTHKPGVTTVATLAASMGAVVFQAGRQRLMDPNGLVMVHNPWSSFGGNADEMERTVQLLRTMESQMLDLFERTTGIERDELGRMLAAETWLDAKQAVQLGFADGILYDQKSKATMTLDQARLAVAACVRGHKLTDDLSYVENRWPRRARAIRQRAKITAILGAAK